MFSFCTKPPPKNDVPGPASTAKCNLALTCLCELQPATLASPGTCQIALGQNLGSGCSFCLDLSLHDLLPQSLHPSNLHSHFIFSGSGPYPSLTWPLTTPHPHHPCSELLWNFRHHSWPSGVSSLEHACLFLPGCLENCLSLKLCWVTEGCLAVEHSLSDFPGHLMCSFKLQMLHLCVRSVLLYYIFDCTFCPITLVFYFRETNYPYVGLYWSLPVLY